MKIAVAASVGLVLGLALGTGAGKMLAPAAVDSTSAADSTAAGGETHTPSAAAGDTSQVPAGGAATDTASSPPDAAAAVPPTSPRPAAASQDHKRLAGILERVPGKDGAVLVAGLSDDELAATLRAMDIAKAAELISALPPARGALMSKRMLDPGGGN